MEGVLLLDGVPEGKDVPGHGREGASLQEVVYASNKENPHGPVVLGVVYLPCHVQGGNCSARNGYPINMQRVWTTFH